MKNAKMKQVATWGVGIAVVAALAAWVWVANNTPGKFDGFAQCLKDEGAVFYGAFWCPHCQNQKALFGKSKTLLPYVECSTVDGKSQLPFCAEKNVKSYPTWEFVGGERLTGEISLKTLAAKTSCPLPE